MNKIVRKSILSIAAVTLFVGAGPCAEDETPIGNPANVNQGDGDDRMLTVDLDADGDGVADDKNGDGVPDEEKRVSVRNLVGCGVGVYVAAQMRDGACINGAIFDCLKRLGL